MYQLFITGMGLLSIEASAMDNLAEMVSNVERAQLGNAEAFEWLVKRFQDMAYGYAFALLGDYALAEDAVQEAFIEAFRSLPDLREARAFPAWFKRIVYKYCDRYLRSKDVQIVNLDEVESFPATQPGPGELSEQSDMRVWVRTVMQSLPVAQRVATTLFYINGYSYAEIAVFLEVPAKTVKSRLFSSRKRLKERIVEMLQDEFKNNSLPEDFAQETLERAVAKAGEMNQKRHFEQAENLLRQVLAKAPGHPGALRELNRNLMWGQVYDHGRWDLLPELVRQGRNILRAGYDEQVNDDLACTLLAVPAVREAIDFLGAWIDRDGPGLRRLGMLSWAKGAAGEYDQAEALWREAMGIATQDSLDNLRERFSTACEALVDCFLAAGEYGRARRAAEVAWGVYRDRVQPAGGPGRGDQTWLSIFLQAGLDVEVVAKTLLAGYKEAVSPQDRANRLCIRAYVDEPGVVIAGWLAWVEERVEASDIGLLEAYRGQILQPLRQRALAKDYLDLSRSIWQQLQDMEDPGMQDVRRMWNWERFNYFPYADLGDWQAVERVAWQGVRESGMEVSATGLILAAAAQGKPSPEELVLAVEQGGVSQVDEYGLCGWYMLAREAAAHGDAEQAFQALDRSVSYWSNPPYYFMNLWEKDTYWGELRDAVEFKRIYSEKRDRIGPIYGMLHYFPRW
jgi:RNA polymerase sigma factor (sigma-70 family)